MADQNDGAVVRGSPWLGSDGAIAHPHAPRTGCGTGRFRRVTCLGIEGNDSVPIPHPLAPAARLRRFSEEDQSLVLAHVTAQQGGAPLANPPPKTKPTTFTVKMESTARSDIDVKAKVLKDGTDLKLDRTAITKLDPAGVAPKYPMPILDDAGKVIGEEGKFELKGTVTIQVLYDTNGSPEEPAEYGRGTTPDDVTNKDTTVGFHESCHIADFTNWLKTKALPVFTGKLGQTEDQYLAACAKFDVDLNNYFGDAEALSEKQTDEVGNPTKSEWEKKHGKSSP